MINNRKYLLMISLLYGSGLRVSELAGLNIQDVDLGACRLRQGKEGKDRYCVLPCTLTSEGLGHHVFRAEFKVAAIGFPHFFRDCFLRQDGQRAGVCHFPFAV